MARERKLTLGLPLMYRVGDLFAGRAVALPPRLKDPWVACSALICLPVQPLPHLFGGEYALSWT